MPTTTDFSEVVNTRDSTHRNGAASRPSYLPDMSYSSVN